MRRSLIVTLVILLLVGTVGGACEWYNSSAVRRYRLALLPVASALNSEDWETAARLTQEISARWEKEAGWMQLWVNHSDADAVSHALRGLEASAMNADALSALLFYGDCMENFDHLHHRDAFTLKNIL